MKINKTFDNASLRTVNEGYIELDYNGKTHCFNDASVVSVNNGSISIEINWEPKRGELVKVLHTGINCYVIFDTINTHISELFTFGSKAIRGCYSKLADDTWKIDKNTEFHPVTPEEQQAFDDFCKSQGRIWNKEKLQWEKYKWEPIQGEWYYFIDYSSPDTINRHRWCNDLIDNRYYDSHNCFQTQKEAELAAEQVKEFLKSL